MAERQNPQRSDATGPGTQSRRRSGEHPIIRAAFTNVVRNVAALSASEIVQLVLWPDNLAAWSRTVGEDDSQLSNMFRRHRAYTRLRRRLAERLDVPVSVLDHLIEATPALPMSRRAPAQDEVLADAGVAPFIPRPPIDWSAPPYPRYREGTNPLERLALRRLSLEILAMPTSRIVGYALWPDSLAAWADRSKRFSLSQVLTSLSGARRYPYVDAALARRLGVRVVTLDEFIRSTKPEPAATQPAPHEGVADALWDKALDRPPGDRRPRSGHASPPAPEPTTEGPQQELEL
jgi:hypothetical protein